MVDDRSVQTNTLQAGIDFLTQGVIENGTNCNYCNTAAAITIYDWRFANGHFCQSRGIDSVESAALVLIDMEIGWHPPNNNTGEPYRTMKIAKETWIIMAIGLVDLATTILFIQHHGAEEANPLFKRYWEMGLAAFVGAKILLLLGPLSVLEWARIRSPRFVSWALRSAIAAYLVMYCVGFYKLNYNANPEYDVADQVIRESRMTRKLAERIRLGRGAMREASATSSPAAASAGVTVY